MVTAAGRDRPHGCTDREIQDAAFAAQQPVAVDGPLRGPPLNRSVDAVGKPHFEISRICMQNLTPQNRVHAANCCAGMVNVSPFLRYTFFRVLFLQPR